MNLREKVTEALDAWIGDTDTSSAMADAAIRTVLEALREPTPGMCEVGEKEMMARHVNLDCFNDPYVVSTWQAMLDAAIREINPTPASPQQSCP